MTIIKKFDTSNKKKFPKKYIILTIVGLFTLTLIEIWANNTAITFGDQYEKLSALEKNLKMENAILENDIAKNSSLQQVSSKAAQLGFSPQLSIQYIR